MGLLRYNGRTNKEFYVEIQRYPDLNIPEREYEVSHVPGRNGDIIFDNGSFKNVDRTYAFSLDGRKHGYYKVAQNVIQWLNSASNYTKLEDSYEPEYFRKAMYKSGAKTLNNFMGLIGWAEITFDCRPQKYLKIGEELRTFKSNFIMRNPTEFTALPLIQIKCLGAGTVIVDNILGTSTITITEKESFNAEWFSSADVYIDSEIQEVYGYKDGVYVNLNSVVSLSSWDNFPKFPKGETSVVKTGAIDSISVTPRWWSL